MSSTSWDKPDDMSEEGKTDNFASILFYVCSLLHIYGRREALNQLKKTFDTARTADLFAIKRTWQQWTLEDQTDDEYLLWPLDDKELSPEWQLLERLISMLESSASNLPDQFFMRWAKPQDPTMNFITLRVKRLSSREFQLRCDFINNTAKVEAETKTMSEKEVKKQEEKFRAMGSESSTKDGESKEEDGKSKEKQSEPDVEPSSSQLTKTWRWYTVPDVSIGPPPRPTYGRNPSGSYATNAEFIDAVMHPFFYGYIRDRESSLFHPYLQHSVYRVDGNRAVPRPMPTVPRLDTASEAVQVNDGKKPEPCRPRENFICQKLMARAPLDLLVFLLGPDDVDHYREIAVRYSGKRQQLGIRLDKFNRHDASLTDEEKEAVAKGDPADEAELQKEPEDTLAWTRKFVRALLGSEVYEDQKDRTEIPQWRDYTVMLVIDLYEAEFKAGKPLPDHVGHFFLDMDLPAIRQLFMYEVMDTVLESYPSCWSVCKETFPKLVRTLREQVSKKQEDDDTAKKQEDDGIAKEQEDDGTAKEQEDDSTAKEQKDDDTEMEWEVDDKKRKREDDDHAKEQKDDVSGEDVDRNVSILLHALMFLHEDLVAGLLQSLRSEPDATAVCMALVDLMIAYHWSKWDGYRDRCWLILSQLGSEEALNLFLDSMVTRSDPQPSSKMELSPLSTEAKFSLLFSFSAGHPRHLERPASGGDIPNMLFTMSDKAEKELRAISEELFVRVLCQLPVEKVYFWSIYTKENLRDGKSKELQDLQQRLIAGPKSKELMDLIDREELLSRSSEHYYVFLMAQSVENMQIWAASNADNDRWPGMTSEDKRLAITTGHRVATRIKQLLDTKKFEWHTLYLRGSPRSLLKARAEQLDAWWKNERRNVDVDGIEKEEWDATRWW